MHPKPVKSSVETLGPTQVKLTVEVPFEELTPAIDAAYKKIGRSVKVQGFRPGKVPQAHVRHLWTILVRAEDTCLSVFEASDIEAVIEATARAGFQFDRVVEVTPVVGSPVESAP